MFVLPYSIHFSLSACSLSTSFLHFYSYFSCPHLFPSSHLFITYTSKCLILFCKRTLLASIVCLNPMTIKKPHTHTHTHSLSIYFAFTLTLFVPRRCTLSLLILNNNPIILFHILSFTSHIVFNCNEVSATVKKLKKLQQYKMLKIILQGSRLGDFQFPHPYLFILWRFSCHTHARAHTHTHTPICANTHAPTPTPKHTPLHTAYTTMTQQPNLI